MSYDLFFKPRSGTFSEEGFHAYFRDRPNYQCEGPQAWYGNEETGVYFVFELQNQAPAGDEDEESGEFPVALNINYFRPSFFVLEAEPEVTAFVRHFDLLVSDLQTNGMGEGEYDAGKLVAGWNHGNEFGYTAILRDESNRKGIHHLPTARLHDAWRWNYGRARLQEEVGENTFVPRIMFLDLGGSTVTAAVWPDGIPIVAPPVDFLCVPRKELAPSRFFRKQEDTTFVAWEKAEPVLLEHGTRNADGTITLDYGTPPPTIVKFVQSLPKEPRSVAGLPADQVLDRELYERSIS